MGNLLATEYIKRDNNEGLKKVENFLKLFQEDFGTTINKIAEKTVTQNKRRGKIELLSMEDIQKLYNIWKKKEVYCIVILLNLITTVHG